MTTAEAAPPALDARWLTRLVTARVRGVPADAIVRRRPLNMVSTSSVLYAVEVRTPAGRPAGAPCVLKLPRVADLRHRREVAFYRTVAPHLTGLVPRCHSADPGVDGPGHLLIEDCSAGRVQDAMDVTPSSAVAAMIRSLARMHARLWNAVPEVPDESTGGADAGGAPLERVLDGWRGDLAGPDLARVRDACLRGDQLRKELSPVRVACHGDFHPLNVFRGPSDTVVVDWQDWYLGNPAEDVARLLAVYVHPLDRRRYESEWLDCYLDELSREAVTGYSRADLLADYRIGVTLALPALVRLLRVGGLRPENVLFRVKHALVAAEDTPVR